MLRCGVFLLDMDEFQEMNLVYARMFGEHRPARTTIQAAKLPGEGLRVEIDCIAYVPCRPVGAGGYAVPAASGAVCADGVCWLTTDIAVVIIEATSATFDGRMMVSALLITLPNSAMYCSATRS